MQVINECALQCVSWMYITLLPTGWRDKLLLTWNVVLHLPSGSVGVMLSVRFNYYEFAGSYFSFVKVQPCKFCSDLRWQESSYDRRKWWTLTADKASSKASVYQYSVLIGSLSMDTVVHIRRVSRLSQNIFKKTMTNARHCVQPWTVRWVTCYWTHLCHSGVNKTLLSERLPYSLWNIHEKQKEDEWVPVSLLRALVKRRRWSRGQSQGEF